MEVKAYWARYHDEKQVHLVVDGDVVCDVFEVPWRGREPADDDEDEKCPVCLSFAFDMVPLAVACKYARVPEGRAFDLGMG